MFAHFLTVACANLLKKILNKCLKPHIIFILSVYKLNRVFESISIDSGFLIYSFVYLSVGLTLLAYVAALHCCSNRSFPDESLLD